VKAAGDILLVSCYELGRQPLAVASAAAFLRRAGFQPVCLDLSVEELGAEALARAAAARLVAISVPMHTALRLGVAAARRIRARAPAVHLCFFGLYAPLNEAHLRAAGADTILGGELEEELVILAAALERGESPRVTRAPLRRLPFVQPDRDGLPPLDRYARLVTVDGERLAGAVEATRGCRHRCRHCPIPALYDGRFFAVPVEIVAADAAAQVGRGARHLTFADPDFLNAPKHALAAARALPPGVTFDVTVKVEHILRHREVFPELARLGCVFVVSAVESLSDRVLGLLDKGHRAADVPVALEIVRAAGLSLRPTFLPFTPFTTAADYLELVHFIYAQDLLGEVDPVQLSLRLLIPPGSLLLERPELAPHLGPLDEAAFTYRWRHPDPRLDELQVGVQALVEESAGEPAHATFDAIHALAARVLGGIAAPPRPPLRRGPTAHLSEPWFC
jgi:radical SAM superfamily enzyme YgiQ (UPF0313 family)